MANKYTSIKELIKDSISVYDGMTTVWPQYGKEELLHFECATFNGTENICCSNNGTLAFRYVGNLYVTPSTRKAWRILEDEGFVEKSFYVPFSNGDYPKSEQYIWEALKAEANRCRYEEFLEDCAKICDKQGVITLDDSILSNAIEIPRTGIKIKHFGCVDTVYPVITSNLLDSYSAKKLGTFCTNNGRVVFVTREGKTYVTKGYKILDKLRSAGYREESIFVPFSNGEEILDPVLAAKWERIKK